MTETVSTVEAAVDRAIARVGKKLVLMAPLGLGKPVQLVNAFYHRAAADPSLTLHIYTALCLEKPPLGEGIEASLDWQLRSGLTASLSYTFSDFSYDEYATPDGDYAGNQLPGIPRHFGFFGLRYLHSAGLQAGLRCRYVGALYADDANSEEDKGYLDVGLRLSYSRQFARWGLHPFVGINNLLDTQYNGNIRINAFGGRYYEPAPRVHFYAGVRVRVG